MAAILALPRFHNTFTFVGHAQGLVNDITVHVTLVFHKFVNVVVSPCWPLMLCHKYFSLASPGINGIVNGFKPGYRLTDFGAAQGIVVMKRVHYVPGGLHGFLLFNVLEHFSRRFRARRHHKIVGQTIDSALFPRTGDVVCRRNQRYRAGRGDRLETYTNLAFRIRLNVNLSLINIILKI